MRSIVVSFSVLSLFVSAFAWASGGGSRQEVRDEIIRRAESPEIIGPGPGDDARDLVDQYRVWNLEQMAQRGLESSVLPVAPWADSYWPTFAGGIANRYGDMAYNPYAPWRENEAYLTKALGKGGPLLLSPAEKYDLLVGSGFALTKAILSGAAKSVGANGEIEQWFGLCHGWAPASFMLPRPQKSVTAKAPDGREILFTPSDIKALGTMLWASAPTKTKFVGGRCNRRDPGRDENHREIDPECFDNNPATWHLAVVNQLGIARRSLVLDVESGREVWNQPLYSYSYDYRHPISGLYSSDLPSSTVALAQFPNDPLRDHRALGAVSVVGIRMRAHYVAENSPSLALIDTPENDVRREAEFEYDLELDPQGNIVGGEWHSPNHPDFLWVPLAGSQARSVGDLWLDRQGDRSEWLRAGPLPSIWREAARGSAQNEQPLARIVEALFDEASR